MAQKGYFNPKLRVYVMRDSKIVDSAMQSTEDGGWEAKEGEEPTIPIEEGNLIISQSNGDMYFDLEDKRIQVAPSWGELTVE